MRDPIIDHKCYSEIVKIGDVECEEILVLVIESLNSVCLTFWKVPNISYIELRYFVFSMLVNSGDKNSTGVYKSPLGLGNIRNLIEQSSEPSHTALCQWSSRRAPFLRCCWAPAMSWFWGRSCETWVLVHPPLKIFVFDREKLHFRFGTVPASVLCCPSPSGFWRSRAWFVPPEPVSLTSKAR